MHRHCDEKLVLLSNQRRPCIICGFIVVCVGVSDVRQHILNAWFIKVSLWCILQFISPSFLHVDKLVSLGESLSITINHCNLVVATCGKKVHYLTHFDWQPEDFCNVFRITGNQNPITLFIFIILFCETDSIPLNIPHIRSTYGIILWNIISLTNIGMDVNNVMPLVDNQIDSFMHFLATSCNS